VGCHWCSLPGTEYSLNDQIKIDLVRTFDAALRDMLSDPRAGRSSDALWGKFETHLRRAVAALARSFDFHHAHMKDVFPDLELDLLCHGTIEKGIDASGGGVAHYNACIDAAGLATVADSFGAIAARVEREQKLTWDELLRALDANFEGDERTRLMLAASPRFGRGGTDANAAAVRIKDLLVALVKERRTPKGFNMIPGFFSWTVNIAMGEQMGATPNGRRAGEPVSHGANPAPGAMAEGGLAALGLAVASVQCGYGNASPLQLEVDPILGKDERGVENLTAFLRAYFEMGGTLVNLNVLGREKLLDAHAHPEKYPDLVVRVTGYSAYFALLTPEYQKMIVERMISA
jgi:formate C-acetyltransferase